MSSGLSKTVLQGKASWLARAPFGGRKAPAILAAGALIGLLDDIQVRFVGIDNLGNGPEILYQACFMAASFAAAYLILNDRAWSQARNLSNLLLGIPVAMLADNVSVDFGTLRPYVLLIPKEGYVWREAVFGQAPVLSQLASWTNEQSFAAGLLNGYVLAVALVLGYVALQRAWNLRPKPTH